MGILKQVWIRDIQEKLLENVEFAARAVNHDAMVSNEKVNVPQAGSVPSVSKNRTDVETNAAKRVDTVQEYTVIVTQPTQLSFAILTKSKRLMRKDNPFWALILPHLTKGWEKKFQSIGWAVQQLTCRRTRSTC